MKCQASVSVMVTKTVNLVPAQEETSVVASETQKKALTRKKKGKQQMWSTIISSDGYGRCITMEKRDQ